MQTEVPRIFALKTVVYKTTDFYGDESNGYGKLTIDKENLTFEYRTISGCIPEYKDLLFFLLSDKDIRKMIKDYQEKLRSEKYDIIKTKGMSNRRDYYFFCVHFREV